MRFLIKKKEGSKKMKLILASNSRTRKEILGKLGIEFEVIPSNVEEKTSKNNPHDYCLDLSYQKAKSVALKLSEGIVLGADSIAYIDGKILEKPKTKEEAKAMLKLLTNKKNYAITGVTIIDLYQNKEISFYEETEVYIDDLNDEEINWYVENEQFIFERAGYSLAGKTALFVPKINGDYYNVLGLPISRIYKELKKLGYKLSDFK